MKLLFTLFFVCIAISSGAEVSTFLKLCEVNKCWAEQKDIVSCKLPAHQCLSARGWIKLHLSLVEQTLAARSTEGLSDLQRRNREMCLQYLHQYWQTGNFPVNEDHKYRTPIFIDRHNNFCAVGYLLKATGNEQISRMIATKSNLAYVHDMKYHELGAWAKENGFTIDELAWIQPGYPPQAGSFPIGRGVDNTVNELFADSSSGQLFVGGNFLNVDSTIVANNIAYVTENSGVYTWHNMGTGVNGQVNAITKYNDKIFVAGSFSMAGGSPVNNVAYWDGGTWHSAGCIAGVVKDLIVFGGSLYASGSFDVCGAIHGVNFAKWNDASWMAIPGLSGTVNTMEVMDTTLLLGGAFAYTGDTLNGVNAIKWNPNTSFQPFAGPVDNEVNDFELFEGIMYAACRHTHTTDSVNLFLKLNSNSWAGMPFPSEFNGQSFNTLCGETGSLNFGGEFIDIPMLGIYAYNCFNEREHSFDPTGGWINVDSTVNKMVIFNGELITGGAFKTSSNGWAHAVTVNGIVKRSISSESVSAVPAAGLTLNLYPDPVGSASSMIIKNNFRADHYAIRDINSKLYADGPLKNSDEPQVVIPQLASGIYLLEVSNGKGDKFEKKFEVK